MNTNTTTQKTNAFGLKPIPLRRKRIMVFDTETNGLFPKINLEMNERGELERLPEIDKYPYILQLSFVVFDLETKTITEKFNEYIRVDDTVEISDRITEINGINRTICKEKGISIVQALDRFYDAYSNVDYVVAHNIAFDKKVMEIELQRNFSKLSHILSRSVFMFNDTYNSRNGINLVCSMELSKKYCNILIERESTYNRPDNREPQPIKYKMLKSPRLEELHYKLFGYKPDNLHNSLVDTMVCLKCYLKIQFEIDFVCEY